MKRIIPFLKKSETAKAKGGDEEDKNLKIKWDIGQMPLPASPKCIKIKDVNKKIMRKAHQIYFSIEN